MHTVKLATFLKPSGFSKENCLSWPLLGDAQHIFQCLVLSLLSLIFCKNSHIVFYIPFNPLVL